MSKREPFLGMSAATTIDRLKELAEGLGDIRAGVLINDCECESCQRNLLDIDLAIKIAEAIAANPEGFRNWYRLTMGMER